MQRAHGMLMAELALALASGAAAPTAGSQLYASQHMEEFLRQVATEHPEGPELPVSSEAASKLPSPSEVMSGTSESATASKASSAVIPTGRSLHTSLSVSGMHSSRVEDLRGMHGHGRLVPIANLSVGMAVQFTTSMTAPRTCASPPSCRSILGSLTGRPLRRRKLQTCRHKQTCSTTL